jgi:hypothetical protein
MAFAQKNLNRFKPVYTVSWLLLKKNINRFKPVHTVSWHFLQKNHKPVQSGSNSFMAFAKKNINRFKPVQTDFRTLAHENTITT